MRLCKVARFCAFLRVFALLGGFCAFFTTKMGCKKAQICTEFCKNVVKKEEPFFAVAPLVIPPFACHRLEHFALIRRLLR